jgi:hypothetical protein
MARPCVLPVRDVVWRPSWSNLHGRMAHQTKEQEVITEWRNLRAGDWFRIHNGNDLCEVMPVTYEVQKIQGNSVLYCPLDAPTKIRICTLGWLIDNGHDFL